MIKRRSLKLGQVSVPFVAVLVTLFSLWVLGTLNSHAKSNVPTQERARTVMIRGPQSNSTQRQQQPEPEPETTQPEIMLVNLDAPPPEKMMLEPLKLDLALPSPTMVSIQVAIQQPAPDSSPVSRPSQPPSSQRPTPQPEPSVQKASQVDHPPSELRQNPAPPYPARKLQQGVEGAVKLRLVINESGQVEDVEVLSGDQDFRRAVMSVVWKWRFTPARHGGRPVKVSALKEFSFTIRRSSQG